MFRKVYLLFNQKRKDIIAIRINVYREKYLNCLIKKVLFTEILLVLTYVVKINLILQLKPPEHKNLTWLYILISLIIIIVVVILIINLR